MRHPQFSDGFEYQAECNAATSDAFRTDCWHWFLCFWCCLCLFITEALYLIHVMMYILLMQEELLRKTQSFERMKEEAQKCLQQAERFKNEKVQFEADVFKKVSNPFVYLMMIASCDDCA